MVAVHDHGAARPPPARRRRLSDHDVHAEREQGRHGHRQPANVLDEERAHLQRRGRQRERAYRRLGVPARRRDARALGIDHLRSARQPEQPALLRFVGALSHALQDRRLLRAAVRDPGERQLRGAAGDQRVGELHGHQCDRGPADHRQHSRRGTDQRQPDRARHDVHRLPQHAGLPAGADLAVQQVPAAGHDGHL